MIRKPMLAVCSLVFTGCLGSTEGDILTPVREVDYASVDVGDLHVCALATDATGLCWGDNITGQLGTNDTETRLRPDFIQTGLKWDVLITSTLHTCGLVAEKAYCWGANNFGQLGRGGESFPILTPDSLTGGLRWLTLAVGSLHTCGTASTDSTTYCWGSSARGQLGNGITGDLTFRPFPVAVLVDTAFVQLTAGGQHTCGLTAAGQAYCWGDATFGQIGTGMFMGSTTPLPVDGGLLFASIDAGGSHTCAVTPAGEGYCWGQGSNGALGNGGTQPKSSPVSVSGGLTFDHISAGGGHSCGHTPTDEVWCWGLNESGQLGTGDTDRSMLPVRLGGSINTFRSVRAGSSTVGSLTCGQATDGKIYCWGRGTEGQIGHGMREQKVLLPTLVDGSF